MKTIAIIGASNNREKFGNKAVRAYLKKGWHVYPVNLKEKEIEGLKAYKSILDVPGQVERVSMYVPPEVGLPLISEIAHKNPQEVFLNPGSESADLVAKAKDFNLKVIQACSIVDIGEQPSNY